MGTKSKWKKGVLHFYNNAVVDENVVVTTAAGALLGYGLSVISSTVNGTYVMAPPIKGVVKDIVVGHNLALNSSFVATVRFSTVAGQVTLVSENSSANGLVLTARSSYPAAVSLRGLSSVGWALTAAGGVGTTLALANVAITTACT